MMKSHLITFGDFPSRRRLICFPFAGGSANAMRPFTRIDPTSLAVSAVEYPGHGRYLMGPVSRRMDDLLGRIMPCITPQLDAPYILFGHSMGALVAFEVARMLAADGRPAPDALIVSACAGPRSSPRGQAYHTLSGPDLVRKLEQLGGLPAEILADSSFLEIALNAIRADFEICETYSYRDGPKLDVPIIAYSGRSDKFVSGSEMKDWALETAGMFVERSFEGGHFYIWSAVAELAHAIRIDSARS